MVNLYNKAFAFLERFYMLIFIAQQLSVGQMKATDRWF
jgi:hypothetical protein